MQEIILFPTENWNVYTSDVEFGMHDADQNMRVKMSAITKHMAEIAGVDYTKRGYSHAFLWEKEMVFLLSRGSIKVHSPLLYEKEYTFTTWEHGMKGPQFFRNFEVHDRNSGEKMLSSTTSWLLVNPNTRKILRPSEFFGEHRILEEKETDVTPTTKIAIPKQMEFAGERIVRYSDMDANGHMNNSNYSDIAFDFLPKEITDQQVKEFAINYNQEAKYGEKIDVYYNMIENEAVVNGTVNGRSCFAVRLVV